MVFQIVSYVLADDVDDNKKLTQTSLWLYNFHNTVIPSYCSQTTQESASGVHDERKQKVLESRIKDRCITCVRKVFFADKQEHRQLYSETVCRRVFPWALAAI